MSTRPPKARDAQFRSRCSIARTLDLVGDKWTLLIIRDLLWHGRHTFKALQASAEKIPSNILSKRLQRLIAYGLVRGEPYQHHPVRRAYHLTDAGRTLEPVLLQIMQWGHRHLDGGIFDPSRRAGGVSTTLRTNVAAAAEGVAVMRRRNY